MAFRNIFCGCCEQSWGVHEEPFKAALPTVGLHTDEFNNNALMKKRLIESQQASQQPHGQSNLPEGTTSHFSEGALGQSAVSNRGMLSSHNDEGVESEAEGRAASARSTTSRASSLTPEEKEREKARLQKLVKDFAKEAVAGMKCTLLNPHTGEKTPQHLYMDRYLSKLKLNPSMDGDEESAVEYLMRDIGSIFKGADVYKKVSSLPEDVALHTVGLEVDKEGATRLYFWFKDTYSRDKFYTCLKILRMSVELNKNK
ncbi:unnamed protein product [Vitrella brassicaformis CCMP3155]|uniref:Uncharacterized protein n=1 Tax=Vitrella brassicaformis (strain CCMP3155) TaxID=1169540 RepID=A0A0G4GQK9_VITBC|nr:unnamed protein product [Vitrella brassicaformis CCMP3155]|mmetsp:Transcript_10974/g.31796  ORF Transcript_10974/g.31796 Transcript_10974/m.31796 type:complete len:257 (+) Transcript_10974:147-917(+)|eukprot:CEM32724.1 unnamed protein product [Vitrella brassicaformis CCMP3155]